jgi:hypothetical protein
MNSIEVYKQVKEQIKNGGNIEVDRKIGTTTAIAELMMENPEFIYVSCRTSCEYFKNKFPNISKNRIKDVFKPGQFEGCQGVFILDDLYLFPTLMKKMVKHILKPRGKIHAIIHPIK